MSSPQYAAELWVRAVTGDVTVQHPVSPRICCSSGNMLSRWVSGVEPEPPMNSSHYIQAEPTAEKIFGGKSRVVALGRESSRAMPPKPAATLNQDDEKQCRDVSTSSLPSLKMQKARFLHAYSSLCGSLQVGRKAGKPRDGPG